MNDRLDILIDECVDAVLSGELTMAECLDQYPEYAADLNPALQMALLTRRLKKPVLAEDRVDALEIRLRGQMLAQARPPARWLNTWSKMAAAVALVFFLTVGAGGGAVAASANSVPGDFLYGLKRLWEAVMLALASLNDAQDDVWLQLAETRLDEAEQLAGRGVYLDDDLLIDLYSASAQAMQLADAETAPRVVNYLNTAAHRVDNLPASAANAPLLNDLRQLTALEDDGNLRRPPSAYPPSLTTSVPVVVPSATFTATRTPLPTSTATYTPSMTATSTATTTPSATATSRVSATATRTPRPSNTPSPTVTPSVTPTATWTPLPLPAITLPPQVRPTDVDATVDDPDNSPYTWPTSEATTRYRATQASVYATQTQQAIDATEEAQP
jgi:hypothetical protein